MALKTATIRHILAPRLVSHTRNEWSLLHNGVCCKLIIRCFSRGPNIHKSVAVKMLTRLVTDYGSTAGNLLITLLTVLISNSLICTWLVSNMQQMATHT